MRKTSLCHSHTVANAETIEDTAMTERDGLSAISISITITITIKANPGLSDARRFEYQNFRSWMRKGEPCPWSLSPQASPKPLNPSSLGFRVNSKP